MLEGIQRAARAAAPLEACGLLFGSDAAISGWSPADNVAENPARHFEIDPAALFAAMKAERAGGPKLIGYWHSHPSGDVQPSQTDAEHAQPDGKLWLIVSGTEAACWLAGQRGRHERFEPLILSCNAQG